MSEEKQISVFFSYGHDCAEIVLRIQKDLTALGFDIWVDSYEIKSGNEWREKITEGILESDAVMAFLSRHALRKNGVCLNELSIAVGCKYGHIKTVLLEPDIEHLIPSTISGIQFCDMSNWRILKACDEVRYEEWYQERLEQIIQILSSTEAVEMNSQLKYLEQMLSPAMWQPRQQSELQKQYVPLQELEEKVFQWIRDKKGSRCFLMSGEPGCGKSSFLINFHHFNHESVAIAFCDWKRKSRDKIGEIIRSIAFQLATKIPAYRTALVWCLENKAIGIQQLDDASLFDALLVNPMYGSIYAEDEVYLVLIDSMNELNENGTNLLAEIIAEASERLPKTIKFVISARMGDVISRYFPDSSSYDFKNATESAFRTIRQFYKLRLAEKLQEVEEIVAEEIIDILAKRSEGNFLFAELCAKAINDGKMSMEDMTEIPSDLKGIFYRWFTSLFPDDEMYQEKYYIPLSILCAVEDPVPQDLLQGIMGWNVPALNKFIRPLKDFLKIQKNAFGNPTITLFHSSMKTWLLSENAGCYMVEEEAGLTAIKEQLIIRFENETISAYQCKILISVLEKTGDDVLRRRVYGSRYFFEQYHALAKAYEKIRGGYYKAILIYTHLKEICQGLPSEENKIFLENVYPVALGRCYCQIGDYHAVKPILAENLPVLERGLQKCDLMEIYYILGSVYDWLGNRGESVELFTKLNKLALEENDASYLLRAITGLIWNEHFTNIDVAISNLERLSKQGKLNSIDSQMADLVHARILLSVGELDEALSIYERCLRSFDFSFNNDVRGYRKNRLMLLEILPACYDVSNYEKGVQTGEQILEKIKNTGWLEECYCTSWIALNYLGMGDVLNAERYLRYSKSYLKAAASDKKSQWLSMHLASIEALLADEKEEHAEALSLHMQVAQMARECDDVWVEGDACFEIAKIILFYNLSAKENAEKYITRLRCLSDSSKLAHLMLKSTLIRSLFLVLTNGQLNSYDITALDEIDDRRVLASTNYIDVYCIKAMIYKGIGQADKVREAIYHIRELIQRPENKNRSCAWNISSVLRESRSEYMDFNTEYCNPFENRFNYWMRLEHLGRYIWACDKCAEIDRAVVADVACADGYGTVMLSSVAEQTFGFDRSGEYIARAPRKDIVEYIKCDIDRFPLDTYKEKFDMVVSFETIEHVKFPGRLIRLFAAMLKPNGYLLMSFPNSAYEKMDELGLNKDHFHLHVFDKNEISAMLSEAGFQVLEELGQSYCNIKCNEENEEVKDGVLSVEQLEEMHIKSDAEMYADARLFALPNNDSVEQSYSFIFRCKKQS